MDIFDPKNFIPVTCPTHSVRCKESWEQLSETEKKYAYYFSRAGWEGNMIGWFQRSYESPALFVLLTIVFSQGIEKLKQASFENGINETEWEQFITYGGTVFKTGGNYKDFGDTKFVPQISKDKFWICITSADHYETYKSIIDDIWENISLEVYTEDPPYYKIGFSDCNESSPYYSYNIGKEDAEMTDRFLKSKGISPLNTRVQYYDDVFHIKIASSDYADRSDGEYCGEYEFEGNRIKISTGDFSKFINKIIENLIRTKEYVANETQERMIEHYIQHFTTGDIKLHKEAMKEWIKDKSPVIETNLGFIETYLDPLGVRAEYEGFVAIVDKEVSKKYTSLVENAEVMIDLFTWDKSFEKDKFNKPDFTSLNIVTFACSGTPIGINIPNYVEIRQTLGYKNVDLTNVYPQSIKSNIFYVKEEVKETYFKYSNESGSLKTALHELLGHGSGKLFFRNKETGEFNFDQENLLNPLTGEKITTWYETNETFGSKFKWLHSGYEECRADSVAFYLSHFDEPFEIFFKGRESEWADIAYIMWFIEIREGLNALCYYDKDSKSFTQAHMMARHAIMRCLYEAGDVFDIEFYEQEDGTQNFWINFDKENVKEKGHKAITPFLNKLHIFRCIGDYENAKEWFEKYLVVDDFFERVRKIVEANKLPRRLEVQPNLSINSEGNIDYKDYDPTHFNIIQSNIDRYPEVFYEDVYNEWVENREKYRINKQI